MKVKQSGAPSNPMLATSPRTQGALCSPKLPPHISLHSTPHPASPHHPQPRPPQDFLQKAPSLPHQIRKFASLLGGSHPSPTPPPPQHHQRLWPKAPPIPRSPLSPPPTRHSPLCLWRLSASNEPEVQRLDLRPYFPTTPRPPRTNQALSVQLDKSNSPPTAVLDQTQEFRLI